MTKAINVGCVPRGANGVSVPRLGHFYGLLWCTCSVFQRQYRTPKLTGGSIQCLPSAWPVNSPQRFGSSNNGTTPNKAGDRPKRHSKRCDEPKRRRASLFQISTMPLSRGGSVGQIKMFQSEKTGTQSETCQNASCSLDRHSLSVSETSRIIDLFLYNFS